MKNGRMIINAQAQFGKEEECLICKKMKKDIFIIKEDTVCGYCFCKSYANDKIMINADENELISKSTDEYTKEYLEKTIRNVSDTRLNINNARKWCLKDKAWKDIDSAIDFLGGMIETFDSTIKSLESELEGK